MLHLAPMRNVITIIVCVVCLPATAPGLAGARIPHPDDHVRNLPAPPVLKPYSLISKSNQFTAPIVVEAAERILGGRFKPAGVVAAGEPFDAQDFLRSLRPDVPLD